MFKKVVDAHIETQETLINELGYISHELKAGRYEEAYKAVEDLKTELVTDVIEISGARDRVKNILEKQSIKKELNTHAGNETV